MTTLLQWFFTSSMLILAILALRRLLGRRISPGVRYALWVVVLVRLLLPVQISVSALPSAAELVSQPAALTQTSIPLLPTTYSMEEVKAGQVPELFRNSDGQLHTTGSAGTVKPSADGTQAVVALVWLSPAQLLLGIWGTGAVALALVLLGSNLRFFAKIRRIRRPVSLPQCPLPVYLAEELHSPCLFGLLRPAIYLTPEVPDLPKEQQRHILTHELTHFRQKDHIWSALRCLALALHWYNPLVWVAVVLSKQDGELSCDAGVINLLGEAQRIPYGRTLVTLVARRSPRPGDLLSCSTAMAEGKTSIQARIAQLVKRPETKKTTLFAVVALAALAAVFTFGGGTQDRTSGREGFLSSLEDAQSVSLSLPSLSSSRYDPITDEDLLLPQVRELLGQAKAWDRENSVALGFQDLASSCYTVYFLDDNQTSAFYLYGGQGCDYVLARLDDSTAGAEPLAVLPEGTISQLEDLFKTQLWRNQSSIRVDYPVFRNQLTELFLEVEVEEGTLLNQGEDYNMEEWLTQHTSAYEVFFGTPWWLKNVPAGWYARAMDGGRWYTIVIPDSIVSQVQAICEEQAKYPTRDVFCSVLNNAVAVRVPDLQNAETWDQITDPKTISTVADLFLKNLNTPTLLRLPEQISVVDHYPFSFITLDSNWVEFYLYETEHAYLLASYPPDEGDRLPVFAQISKDTVYQIFQTVNAWRETQPGSASIP